MTTSALRAGQDDPQGPAERAVGGGARRQLEHRGLARALDPEVGRGGRVVEDRAGEVHDRTPAGGRARRGRDEPQAGVGREDRAHAGDRPGVAAPVDRERARGGRHVIVQEQDADGWCAGQRPDGRPGVVVGQDLGGTLTGQGAPARAVLREPDAVAPAAAVERHALAERRQPAGCGGKRRLGRGGHRGGAGCQDAGRRVQGRDAVDGGDGRPVDMGDAIPGRARLPARAVGTPGRTVHRGIHRESSSEAGPGRDSRAGGRARAQVHVGARRDHGRGTGRRGGRRDCRIDDRGRRRGGRRGRGDRRPAVGEQAGEIRLRRARRDRRCAAEALVRGHLGGPVRRGAHEAALGHGNRDRRARDAAQAAPAGEVTAELVGGRGRTERVPVEDLAAGLRVAEDRADDVEGRVGRRRPGLVAAGDVVPEVRTSGHVGGTATERESGVGRARERGIPGDGHKAGVHLERGAAERGPIEVDQAHELGAVWVARCGRGVGGCGDDRGRRGGSRRRRHGSRRGARGRLQEAGGGIEVRDTVERAHRGAVDVADPVPGRPGLEAGAFGAPARSRDGGRDRDLRAGREPGAEGRSRRRARTEVDA